MSPPSIFPIRTMAPSGPGAYVAFPSMLGGYDAIIDKAADLGLHWLAPRGGDRGRDQNWTSPKAVRAIAKAKSKGIGIYPWVYSRPDAITTEVEIMRQFLLEGAAGCIIDAEDPWAAGANKELQDQKKALAARYMDQMRRMLPAAFIAHCPYAYPAFHSDFPYVEFGMGCDMVMPQLYWTEFNNSGFMKHFINASAQWAVFAKQHPQAAKPVCMMGNTYGSELRGVLHPPPGVMTVADFDLFVKSMANQPCIPLYSLEASKADILEYMRNTWAGMTQEIPPTQPDTTVQPFGQETEAEWRAAEEARDEERITQAREEFERRQYGMVHGEEPIPESLRKLWGDHVFAERATELTAWDRKPFHVRRTCAEECKIGLSSPPPPPSQ